MWYETFFMYVFVYRNSYIRIYIYIYLYLSVSVYLMHFCLTMMIHLIYIYIFWYLCKCMQIKTNIYPSTIAHPILICHRHLRRRVFFRSTPPMPNLRMPVRHPEKGRRQHGNLVWRTLGFGDLGKMCGFVWKYVCVCVPVRVPVCMCAPMMT